MQIDPLIQRVTLGITSGLLAAVGFACGAAATSPSSTASTTTTTTTAPSPVTFSPSTLAFPINAAAGSTQTVVLTNAGSAPLNITSIAASGDFSEGNDCGSSVAPSATCSITVTFNPVAAGSGGTLTITDDATGSPQIVGITGPNVLAPSAIWTPPSLSFGTQGVGTTTPIQTVTLENRINGVSAPLAISRLLIAGDFAVAQNGCGDSLPPGTTCTIGLTFTPTAQGFQAGALSIVANSSPSMQSVSLSGTGR